MAHRFDISQRAKLDNPERRKMLHPEDILRNLGLKTGEVMADIGCGIGYFTIPAGLIVGEEGRVYALDITDEMLQEVNKAKKSVNLTNIEIIKTAEYDLELQNDSVTFAFTCNVLHEIEDLSRFFGEIKRILKNKARFAVIDWEKKISRIGPPMEHRLDKEQLIARLMEQEFKLIDCQSISGEYYSIIMEKR